MVVDDYMMRNVDECSPASGDIPAVPVLENFASDDILVVLDLGIRNFASDDTLTLLVDCLDDSLVDGLDNLGHENWSCHW